VGKPAYDDLTWALIRGKEAPAVTLIPGNESQPQRQ
jgi:hypothetical protein